MHTWANPIELLVNCKLIMLCQSSRHECVATDYRVVCVYISTTLTVITIDRVLLFQRDQMDQTILFQMAADRDRDGKFARKFKDGEEENVG